MTTTLETPPAAAPVETQAAPPAENTPPPRICVGCAVEVGQRPTPTCPDCWRKVPKAWRVEFTTARQAFVDNTSNDPDRVKRKQHRLMRAVDRILGFLLPKDEVDEVSEEPPTAEVQS